MTTLRSLIAYLAAMVRCAGIVYIVVQVAILHSFYTQAPWRLAAPAVAVAWAAMIVVYLRRSLPPPWLACADSAVYVALALAAQQCVPPGVRDDAFSWLVISMSGQVIVPEWYAPRAVFPLLALATPAAYWTGVMMLPGADARTATGAAVLLIIVGVIHGFGRWVLYGRAAAADAALDRADRAASDQYAVLSRTIERREHERLVHDTVLNTLTALARAGSEDAAQVVSRCRQDIALIEGALGDPGDLATGAGHPSGDLLTEVRDVAADMRDRGLIVHLETGDGKVPALPARVVAALSNAAREALSNVATHAGTGEAWLRVRVLASGGPAGTPFRVEVIVRDRGRGFDPARVDQARLGLRRSIAERIADCGGQAWIRSELGQGTGVRLAWPAPVPAPSPPADPEPARAPRPGRALSRDGRSW
jgi:signal transduction histidine kinase